MCGITGSVWSDERFALKPDDLKRMLQTLVHRGPDAEDQYFYSPWPDASPHAQSASGVANPAGVALGFRRLAIIDLATGMQPIGNEDGSVQVVFNGEIYNYRELRRRLEGSGHQFRTEGDAETIVHLYEDEGADCFRHLNGMFSVAIWDRNRNQLLLARDRLGQKPLYYYHDSTRLVFGSELKAVLEAPNIPREIDPNAIDQFLLYQYVPYPGTIYQQIQSLEPGQYLCWRAGQPLMREYYWSLPSLGSTLALADATVKIRETLEDSVRLRLQSDVPLGVFLSGGVDSSLIASIAQRMTSDPIETFSIGFQESEYDESRYSKMVAEHLGTKHQAFVVQPDAIKILPNLVHHFDQPFADSSAIPTWYLSRMTRQSVTVALSGDGSDELFGGYQRYQAASLAGQLDRLGFLKSAFSSSLWQKIPSDMSQRNHLRRWKRFCEAMSLSPLDRYLQWIGIFSDAGRANLYSDSFVRRLADRDPSEFLRRPYRQLAGRSAVTRFSLTDLTTYLPCDLNTKVDRASMAHSLEVRQPFLDYRLVELAAGLPGHWKRRRGKGKWILKQTFSGHIPQEIWARRKQGFGVPLDHWFRGPLRELAEERLLGGLGKRGLFQENEVRRLVQQHVDGRFDHAYRLWSLLILESWLERWAPDFKIED